MVVSHLLIMASISQQDLQRMGNLSSASTIQHEFCLEVASTLAPKRKKSHLSLRLPEPAPAQRYPAYSQVAPLQLDSMGRGGPHHTSASTTVRSDLSSRFVIPPSCNTSAADKWHP